MLIVIRNHNQKKNITPSHEILPSYKIDIINALNNVVSSVNFDNGTQVVNYNAWAIAKEFKLHFKDTQQKTILVKHLIIN